MHAVEGVVISTLVTAVCMVVSYFCCCRKGGQPLFGLGIVIVLTRINRVIECWHEQQWVKVALIASASVMHGKW